MNPKSVHNFEIYQKFVAHIIIKTKNNKLNKE